MDLSFLNPDSELLKSLSSGLGLFLTVVGVLTVVFGPVLRRLTLSHSLSRLDALEKTARAYAIAYKGSEGQLPKAEAKYPLESALDSVMSPLQLGDAQLAVLAEKHRTTAANAYVMATIGLGSMGMIGLISSLLPAYIVTLSPTLIPTLFATFLFLAAFYFLLRWRMASLRKRASQISERQVQRFMAAVYPDGEGAVSDGQSATAPEKDTVVQPKKESGPQDGDQDEETPPAVPSPQPKGCYGAALALIIGLLLLRRLR